MMKHLTLRAMFAALLTAGAVGVACSSHARDEDTMAHPLGESTVQPPASASNVTPSDAGESVVQPLEHAVPLSHPPTTAPATTTAPPATSQNPPAATGTPPSPANPPAEPGVPAPTAPTPVAPTPVAPSNPPPPAPNPNPPPAPNPNPPAPTPPTPAPMPAPSTPPSMMPMHVQTAPHPFAGATAYRHSGSQQAVPMQVRTDGGVPVTPLPRDAGPVTIRNDGAIGGPKLDGGNIRVPRSDGGLR